MAVPLERGKERRRKKKKGSELDIRWWFVARVGDDALCHYVRNVAKGDANHSSCVEAVQKVVTLDALNTMGSGGL